MAAPSRASPTHEPAAPDGFVRASGLAEASLERALRTSGLPGALGEAVRYASLGAGKRLRPALTFLSCESCGGAADRAAGAAAAVELIHAFSLVHDDLPAMDDDDLRRGQPTTHVKFGEAAAILAGDAMMSLAFATIVEDPTIDRALAAGLVAELARATNDMIAGQARDTIGAGIADPGEAVRTIHRQKTGALIRAACRMGGMCAGADAPALHAVTAYGEAVGVMFQIVDDLIDVEQEASHTGKRTGKDSAAGKLTYPGVFGVEASRAEVARLRGEADRALAPLGVLGRDLREVCAFLAVRTR